MLISVSLGFLFRTIQKLYGVYFYKNWAKVFKTIKLCRLKKLFLVRLVRKVFLVSFTQKICSLVRYFKKNCISFMYLYIFQGFSDNPSEKQQKLKGIQPKTTLLCVAK